MEKISEFIKNMNILKKGYIFSVFALYIRIYNIVQLFRIKMQTLFKTEENKDRMDTPGCSLYIWTGHFVTNHNPSEK